MILTPQIGKIQKPDNMAMLMIKCTCISTKFYHINSYKIYKIGKEKYTRGLQKLKCELFMICYEIDMRWWYYLGLTVRHQWYKSIEHDVIQVKKSPCTYSIVDGRNVHKRIAYKEKLCVNATINKIMV